jgi:hypothetical protein
MQAVNDLKGGMLEILTRVWIEEEIERRWMVEKQGRENESAGGFKPVYRKRNSSNDESRWKEERRKQLNQEWKANKEAEIWKASTWPYER